MSKTVKCKICGKKIDRDTAYIVRIKDKNNYYCNEHEYKEHQHELELKNKIFMKCFEIFEYPIKSSAFYKEINGLLDKFPYEDIYTYICNDEDYLNNTLRNKMFKSEFAKIRYFCAIIRNKLNETHYDYSNDVKKNIEINEDTACAKYKPQVRKKSLSDIEKEVGG